MLTRPRWWPGIGTRIPIYLIIIAALFFLRHRRPENPAPADGTEPAPAPAPAPAPTAGSADLASGLMDQLYPQITFYAWSREARANGAQEVVVLARFEKNVDSLHWKELCLRGPKKGNSDLAVANPPEGQERPQRGMSEIRFVIPPQQPEFTEGRVWCWNRDLCALPPDRRVTPEQLAALRQGAQEPNADREPQPEDTKP